MKQAITTRAKTPTRRERALATRRRILAAAYRLFCDRGYAATTMDAIAEKADVAVQTLYFTFHTKGAILSETVGACVVGFDRWDPRVDPLLNTDHLRALRELHAWFPAFEKERDVTRALSMFVDATLDILERIAPIASVVAAATASDAEVRATAEIGEHRRIEGFRLIVEMIIDKSGASRRGSAVQKATDVMLTLLSAETFQQLRAGRGWSRSECKRWLMDVLGHQLLR